MAIGTRSEPEKDLDSMFKPKSSKRFSRKKEKQGQNRKDRHLANIDPEIGPRAKYSGYEW